MDRFLGKKVGPYRLVKRLGAGGMGAVYLGLHSTIDSKVAIKILHRRYLGDRDMVRRFIDEARLVNRIDHPGIVRIFDCDSSGELGLYLVMELLEGQTLLERWHRRPALPPAAVVRVLHQVADALAAAHALGIVHRDLKPSNIFLVREPAVAGGWRAKVFDFGVAKLLAGHRGTITGQMMGTLLYMSPEQRLDSKHVDGRSDVYSLGVIAYFLLSGRHPFDDRAVVALAQSGRNLAPPPLPSSKGVPPELAKIVARALSIDREQRFPSMVALRDALAGLAAILEPADTEVDEKPPAGAAPAPDRPARSLLEAETLSDAPRLEAVESLVPDNQSTLTHEPRTISLPGSEQASLARARGQPRRGWLLPAALLAALGAVALVLAWPRTRGSGVTPARPLSQDRLRPENPAGAPADLPKRSGVVASDHGALVRRDGGEGSAAALKRRRPFVKPRPAVKKPRPGAGDGLDELKPVR